MLSCSGITNFHFDFVAVDFRIFLLWYFEEDTHQLILQTMHYINLQQTCQNMWIHEKYLNTSKIIKLISLFFFLWIFCRLKLFFFLLFFFFPNLFFMLPPFTKFLITFYFFLSSLLYINKNSCSSSFHFSLPSRICLVMFLYSSLLNWILYSL